MTMKMLYCLTRILKSRIAAAFVIHFGQKIINAQKDDEEWRIGKG